MNPVVALAWMSGSRCSSTRAASRPAWRIDSSSCDDLTCSGRGWLRYQSSATANAPISSCCTSDDVN
eukprot:2670634-Prymnesium_polylepis.1